MGVKIFSYQHPKDQVSAVNDTIWHPNIQGFSPNCWWSPNSWDGSARDTFRIADREREGRVTSPSRPPRHALRRKIRSPVEVLPLHLVHQRQELAWPQHQQTCKSLSKKAPKLRLSPVTR